MTTQNQPENKKITRESGQGLVEFSLILIAIIGLFVGIFEIMTLINKWNDLETATRMATRQAAESWIPSGPNPNIEADITLYLREEMVNMGYQTGQISSDVRVEVIAHEFSGGALVEDTSSKACTYGEYISVKAEMDYRPVVLPLDVFFDTSEDGAGVLTAQYINRCVRGQ